MRNEKKTPTIHQVRKILFIKLYRENLNGENRHQMRVETDQEINQHAIAEIKKKYNVLHYNSKFNDGNAIGAGRKICELKSRLRNFKRLVKKDKLKPKGALKKQLIT